MFSHVEEVSGQTASSVEEKPANLALIKAKFLQQMQEQQFAAVMALLQPYEDQALAGLVLSEDETSLLLGALLEALESAPYLCDRLVFVNLNREVLLRHFDSLLSNKMSSKAYKLIENIAHGKALLTLTAEDYQRRPTFIPSLVRRGASSFGLLSQLLQKGAPVNSAEGSVISILCKKSLDITDADRRTIIHCLLDYGANLYLCEQETGRNPFHAACLSGLKEVVQIFIEWDREHYQKRENYKKNYQYSIEAFEKWKSVPEFSQGLVNSYQWRIIIDQRRLQYLAAQELVPNELDISCPLLLSETQGGLTADEIVSRESGKESDQNLLELLLQEKAKVYQGPQKLSEVRQTVFNGKRKFTLEEKQSQPSAPAKDQMNQP